MLIRRLLLILPVFLLAACAGAASLSLPPEAETRDGALHALNRLGFGAKPGEVEQVLAMGVGNWVSQQLAPQSIPESAVLTAKLSAMSTLSATDAELIHHDEMLRRDKSDEGKQAQRDYNTTVLEEAQAARIDRALLSDRQLQEVLVGFWFNHFNVFRGKGFDHVWVGTYESEAIRPYVLGPFRLLLEATARHPAMLYYLDNWQNSAPGSRGRGGQEVGLNENYARELMELHTLGVDGGYTQKDVTELARVLTGWGLRDRPDKGRFGMQRQADFSLVFDISRHDYGDKVLLGQVIKGDGWREVEKALDILAASPATAKHLSFQLAQYFVADDPDPKLVYQMASTYMKTGGNLTAVMRTMLESPVFWSAGTRGHKFKTPFEYAISAMRATSVQPDNLQPVMGWLNQLGQPIYGHETPDGYKQVESAWLNPDAMARRLSFATNLGSGRYADQSYALSDATIRTTLPVNLQPQTMAALEQSEPRLRPALLLGSPDFMYR
jgi:uncharacterized protein (DUF1800 family)